MRFIHNTNVYCLFSADLVTEAQRVKNGLNFVTLSISENSIRHYLNAENIKLLDQDHEPLPKESVLRTYTDLYASYIQVCYIDYLITP